MKRAEERGLLQAEEVGKGMIRLSRIQYVKQYVVYSEGKLRECHEYQLTFE